MYRMARNVTAMFIVEFERPRNVSVKIVKIIMLKAMQSLKELNMIDAEVITESMEVGKLCTRRMHGGHYHLRQQLKQNWDENGDFKVYPEKTILS
mgnify:CR=1 FL=1